MQKRDVAISLILTVVTCGLYGLYWMAKLTDDIHRYSGRPQTAGGAKAALFTVLSCGFYFYYWVYKIGGELVEARRENKLPPDSVSNSVYLLAVAGSTILLTFVSVLQAFADVYRDGQAGVSEGEAILIALIAGMFVFACHMLIALIITWFIYKRSDPSPRILYIMFSIFRIHILTTAFLQASLNDAIARTAVETTQPAVSLYKK